MKCGLETLKSFRCVCCSRPGYTRELETVLGRRYKRLVFIVDDDELLSTALDTASSTKVRKRLIDGKGVRALVPDDVESYIIAHAIGHKLQAAGRWSAEDVQTVPYSPPQPLRGQQGAALPQKIRISCVRGGSGVPPPADTPPHKPDASSLTSARGAGERQGTLRHDATLRPTP